MRGAERELKMNVAIKSRSLKRYASVRVYDGVKKKSGKEATQHRKRVQRALDRIEQREQATAVA